MSDDTKHPTFRLSGFSPTVIQDCTVVYPVRPGWRPSGTYVSTNSSADVKALADRIESYGFDGLEPMQVATMLETLRCERRDLAALARLPTEGETR